MSNPIKRFKERHIKPTLFYKLYRVLKFSPFKSYSGYAEDAMLSRIYRLGRFKKAGYKGVFVDVGCNHPMVGNTTYALYKKGWQGLNLDLTADNIRLCKVLRPRDTSVQCAITEDIGEIEAYIFDQGSGLNTLDKEAAEKGAALIGKPYTIEKIPSMPLNNIIEKELGVNKIDVLNVDVEGHEMSVLGTFDFEKYAPDLITCEIHGDTLENVIAHDVYKLISSKGYQCFSHYGATAFFARNDWDFIY